MLQAGCQHGSSLALPQTSHPGRCFLPLAFSNPEEDIRHVRASHLIHALLVTDFLYNLNQEVGTYFMETQSRSPQIGILPL